MMEFLPMPEGYAEPSPRQMEDDHRGDYMRGDRVVMSGTDLSGVVRADRGLSETVFVDWDYFTAEEGEQSWIDTDYLVLYAVREDRP